MTKTVVKKVSIVKLKQKVALDNLMKGSKKVGKGGKMKKPTMTEAMVDAGYSIGYAQSGNIMKKKSWIELCEEYMSDELLAEKTQALINKKETVVKFTKSGIKVHKTGEIDQSAVKAGLELAFKVRGKMSPEQYIVEQKGIANLSEAELDALIAKQSSRFKKTD